jgi:dienelactone hydrolase
MLPTLIVVSGKAARTTDEETSMRGRRTAGLIGIVTAVVAGLALTSAQAEEGSVATGQDVRQAALHTHHHPHGTSQVIIDEVVIRVAHQQPVSAYLVRPGGGPAHRTHPGVLFLHWLGQIHNDRTEYLAEATSLAQRGVVSLLPQGYFPWVPDPDGTPRDVQLVRDQVAAYQAALDRLVASRGVDRDRIAIVGHDYGAMYGSLVADQDTRVRALVLEAPDSTWGNWFATYWLGLEGQERADYLALFDGLDPVQHTARLGSHVLFQWAGQDVFITPEVMAAFATSSPQAQVLTYPSADHLLTDAALRDRDAFLAEQLGLPGE